MPHIPLAVKLAVLMFGDLLVAASNIPDANLVLNVLMLVVLLFGAPRFFRAKAAEAQLTEKDHVITTHEQTIQALNEHHGVLEQKVVRLEAAAAKVQADHSRLVARYEEQAKYTAKEALMEVSAQLGRIEELLRAWLTRDAAMNALFDPRERRAEERPQVEDE